MGHAQRHQIPLNEYFKVEVWYDVDSHDSRFKLCQRLENTDNKYDINYSDILEGKWIVRAEFQHVTEFIKYISTFDWNTF